MRMTDHGQVAMDLPNTRLWRDDPRPKASSPLIIIPIVPSVPSCSKPSRCGLARAKHAAMLARRPTLTAPARAGVSEAQIRTKTLMEKERLRRAKLIDKKRPIQGLLGLHTRYGPSDRSTAQGGLCREASALPVTQPSRSLATGSIDNSPGGILLHR